MKFVVDAQLPRSLAVRLIELGYDAIHVKDLPSGSAATDSEIAAAADAEGRVVVTKDADFRHTHETGGQPARLLHVSVGNVRNSALLDHLTAHHRAIAAAFENADYVELGMDALILHPRRDP